MGWSLSKEIDWIFEIHGINFATNWLVPDQPRNKVAGVDVLRSERGPLVMEVNSSPGLKGIEQATGKDIAGMIIDFIEKKAKPNKTRTRGKG